MASQVVGLHDTSRSKPPAVGGLNSLNMCTRLISHLSANWVLDLLAQHSTSLRSLSLSAGWSLPVLEYTLAHITLPNLEDLYLNDCRFSRALLTNFLARHPTIKLLDVGDYLDSIEDSWSPPPFFLPHLTNFVTWPNMFGLLMKPSLGYKHLPSLKELTFWIIVAGRHPFIQNLEREKCIVEFNDCAIQTLRTVRLGLRLRVGWTADTNWVKDRYEGQEHPNHTLVRTQVKSVQIHLEELPGFFESRDIRLHLAEWFRLFPAIESVEMWHCRPMDQENLGSRKELARRVQAMNPSLQSFRVCDIELLE
ncbi:hypothetical protein AX16_006749 [Volvariella volvacea WC 439]|nr:hypothetical protein AX16_006749 [Volvariella volvacea WC 439]